MHRDLTIDEDYELTDLVVSGDQIELVSWPNSSPGRLDEIKQLFQVYAGYSDDAYEDAPIRQGRAEPDITPDIERDFLERADHSLMAPTEKRPRSLWGRIACWITSWQRPKPAVTPECAAQLS